MNAPNTGTEQSNPPPVSLATKAGQRVADIDSTRTCWAKVAIVAAAFVGLVAVVNLFWDSYRLLEMSKKAETIDLHFGLALTGKAITVAVLFASSFALIRAAERLIMPLQDYIKYVEANRKGADPSAVVDEVINRLESAARIKDVS